MLTAGEVEKETSSCKETGNKNSLGTFLGASLAAAGGGLAQGDAPKLDLNPNCPSGQCTLYKFTGRVVKKRICATQATMMEVAM
jgi:hypothetical protein